jgi:two-component system sensor histidine kinase FlrB
MNPVLDRLYRPEPNSPLADAFTAFMAAASRLEDSHRHLHTEVVQLREQLGERNRQLAYSIHESERVRVLLGQILDALPCGVVVLDVASDRIILTNPEACRLLEIDPRSAEWGRLPARIRSAVELKDPAIEGEQERCIEIGNEKRWLAIRCREHVFEVPSQKQPAVSRYLVVILREITSAKIAEIEREDSRRMLALAEMATVLAHEIRNPLGTLELLSGLVNGDPNLNEESRQWVRHLQAGVRSLSATVNNVLRFYTFGMPDLMPVALGPVLRSSFEFVQPQAMQADVALQMIEELGNAEIEADRNSIQQLILNLVCNALRYTQTGGKITLAANLDQERHLAVIELSDTGSGIAPEHLTRIFEAGFSASGQTPGLGLTVCQRIVEQHRGLLGITSQLGMGTTVRMEFPLA